MEHADGYVTITRALADELERRMGARAAGVDVIPDGARRSGAAVDLGGPPRVGGAGKPGPLVTCVGHLYPWKGVETLLGALAAAPGWDCADA